MENSQHYLAGTFDIADTLFKQLQNHKVPEICPESTRLPLILKLIKLLFLND
ncbi:MAG: hypothetical protein ACOCWM_01360 [Cyclobacteriaceae bacterium]